ncbi:Protein yippee-like [Capsicum annuum]|nr:Protein yippee-like [Capsicum annuum]
MGRLFLITLEGNIYSCKHCHTHLGLADHIISKHLNRAQGLDWGKWWLNMVKIEGLQVLTALPIRLSCGLYGGRGLQPKLLALFTFGAHPRRHEVVVGVASPDLVNRFWLYTISGMDPHSAFHSFLQTFQCRHGRAYLFDRVVNVTLGEKEERMMLTGMHTVVDIFCVGCGSIVGWKYEAAQEKSQKYKEGKFILERFKILSPDGSSYSIIQDAQLGGSDTDEP